MDGNQSSGKRLLSAVLKESLIKAEAQKIIFRKVIFELSLGNIFETV